LIFVFDFFVSVTQSENLWSSLVITLIGLGLLLRIDLENRNKRTPARRAVR
jgi:hypothetical protein